ncbi:MAG TPA: hypothetical protein VD993_00075 [Chitinophagaceae bacterium]|nr:hypothetical protein [Chitinophagaceae bacterium]
MANLIRLLLILLISVKAFSQDIQFETKFSKSLAVYQFLSSLSSRAPDNPYKKLFNLSSFNTKKYSDLIHEFELLKLNFEYEFDAYPIDQKIGGYSESFLKRNLGLSNDLQEFKLRSLGLVPNADLLKLCDLLMAFTPVYETVIYQPSKQHFQQQLNGITNLIKSTNLNNHFTIASKFFNSSWDPSIPFVFCFYPLPNSRRFTATAVNDVSISAIPDTLDSYNGLLSVMLHEMSHILFDEKPLETWKQIDEWFTSNPSRVSRYAYNLFNEVLATAVANGYLYAQLNGKENPGGWYGVKYINLMAKQVYPVVKEYLANQKSIDQNFVNSYISLFEQHFSGWLIEMDHLMMGRRVLSENAADFSSINRKFRSASQNGNEISTAAIVEMKKHPTTKMIIVNKNNAEKLELIKNNFNELKDWQFDPKRDFVYSAFLQDKTWLIVLNNVNGTIEEKLQNAVITPPK